MGINKIQESVNAIKVAIYEAEHDNQLTSNTREYLLELCDDLMLEMETKNTDDLTNKSGNETSSKKTISKDELMKKLMADPAFKKALADAIKKCSNTMNLSDYK